MRTAFLATGFATLLVGMTQPASAQFWADAGLPTLTPYAPLCYADTVHNALYVGGYYPVTDSIGQYMPLYRYQNGNWDLSGRFNQRLNTAVVYHDTLIVAGVFTAVSDTSVVHIACYDGEHWHPYGEIGSPVISGGDVIRLRVIDDTLYALGVFSEADGQPSNGLAKRVGGHWEEVGPHMDYISASFTDIVKYQGHLVVGGNFTTADQSIRDLMQLNGDTWVAICDCLQGGFDAIGELAVYKGDLYIGGVFYYSLGNVGQSLMRWDGSQWYRVGEEGGSLQMYNHSDQYPPYINVFAVRDSLLFIGGAFFFADHLPVNHIVTWDGHHFCSLGGYPGTEVTSMDFYQDTLFVATGYQVNQPTGPAPNCVAKFTGSSYQLECSTTGVEELAVPMDGFRIATEASGAIALTGLPNGPHDVRIYDAQGRSVLTKQIHSTAGRSEEVVLNELVSALYIVRVDGVQTAKFIPLR